MSEFTEEAKTYLSNMNIEVVVKEKRFYNVRDFAGCRRRLEEACEIIEAKDEELAILQDEYTCEECEECFVDKETGINAPSICMSCWNAMVTKFLAELKVKNEEIVRLKGESDLIPVFMPWYTFPECSKELPQGDIDSHLSSEVESYFISLCVYLTKEQKYWAQYEVTHTFGGDLNLFKKEYPSS